MHILRPQTQPHPPHLCDMGWNNGYSEELEAMMKYIMYQGNAYEQKGATGGLCNAKDGELVKGFLIKNAIGEVFILTPTIDYGDPHFGNVLQYFYTQRVKPDSVKKIGATKDISEFAMEEYSRSKT